MILVFHRDCLSSAVKRLLKCFDRFHSDNARMRIHINTHTRAHTFEKAELEERDWYLRSYSCDRNSFHSPIRLGSLLSAMLGQTHEKWAAVTCNFITGIYNRRQVRKKRTRTVTVGLPIERFFRTINTIKIILESRISFLKSAIVKDVIIKQLCRIISVQIACDIIYWSISSYRWYDAIKSCGCRSFHDISRYFTILCTTKNSSKF